MKEKSWAYHSPEFECDKFNTEMMKYSPWSGHRVFAYDLVANFQPEKIVELGSYYGCSAFSFLQAIKDLGLDTEFFGIDTWSGDGFTSADYQEDIYSAYKLVQDSCFEKQRANMLRMTFDNAASMFSNESIDLLHIDGSHTYEDVKHDFYTWKDKVKNTGIILFHDVSDDKLYGKVMGSHLFWEEVKEAYPYTMEFPFSFGLGILFYDKAYFEMFKESVSMTHYQQIVNHGDVINKDVIRKAYFERRDLKRYIHSLEQQVQISQTHLGAYEKSVSDKDTYIRQLEQQIEKLTFECQDTYTKYQKAIKGYEDDICILTKSVSEKESYIEELVLTIQQYEIDHQKQVTYIEELTAGIEKYAADQRVAQEYIAKLEKTVRDLNEAIARYQSDIDTVRAFLEGEKQDYKGTLQEKEQYISELEQSIMSINRLVGEKEAYISELKMAISSYEITCKKKDEYIQELSQTIEKYKTTVTGKEAYIAELERAIGEYNKTTDSKNEYIEELKQTILKYSKSVNGKDEYIDSLECALEDYKVLVQGKDGYISSLERKLELVSEDERKSEITITELQAHIDEISLAYKKCRSELIESQETNTALRRRQNEIEYQNIDMQKSMEYTYEVLEKYKREMSQSIIGRHFIKRVEKKNEQS